LEPVKAYKYLGVTENHNIEHKNEKKSWRRSIVKSKAVPLHAMEAHGGRGGIAPTHS
jgi:hypothetical protein